MAKIIVIGAGLGGLAAALFLARRGHKVELFERDYEEPPQGAEACFERWQRRGVAQARQPHTFFALASKILAEEAPDVLAGLKTIGAHEYWFAHDSAEHPLYLVRRLVHEAVLERAAAAESGISWHRGTIVSGLIAEAGAVPHVTGVRTALGEDYRGDLVVDASGRWTAARDWLGAIGARPWSEEFHDTPLFYLTRWYRLKPGASFPKFELPINLQLNYIGGICFPADNGVFSLTLNPLMSDPLRAKLTDPKLFDAFVERLPAFAPWFAVGDPITNPLTLARINNAYRRIVDRDGPIVTGFVLLGDAAMHTNPTLGRGASLAYYHAQGLARLVDGARADASGLAAALDSWTDQHIGCWFADQVEVDALSVKALDGWRNPVAGPPTLPFFVALTILGRSDPTIGEAVSRHINLLAHPRTLAGDPAVVAKVNAFREQMLKGPPPPPAGPTRAEFEAMVGA